MTFSDFIDRNAAFAPDKPAILFAGSILTYSGLSARIAQAARTLTSELGVVPGDRIAVLAYNHPDTLILLYACARLGAMLAPLNWRLTAPELSYMLNDCSPKALFVEDNFSSLVESFKGPIISFDGVAFDSNAHHDGPLAPIDLSHPLLIVYTSGATGRPKGAVLSQQALFFNAVNSQHMHDLTSQDHILTTLPLFHVGGLNIQTTPALQIGATVTLHPRFAPDAVLNAIARDRPTLTVLVPAAMQAMIDHPLWPETDFSSLRAIATGSTTVPQPLIDAFAARGPRVLQVYGATETCPIAIYDRIGSEPRKGATGLPGLTTQARIVSETGEDAPPGAPGEVLIRGPHVFAEYWRDPAATAEALRDGWHRTGDIAIRDEDGYFTICDRKKNLIISGGENVYPAEIELALHDHPCVAEAAAIGRPDPRWQEVPVAFIVRRKGMDVSAADLTDYLQKRLARFKIPREFTFVESLPRNVMGKTQHFRLREGLLAEQAASSRAEPEDEP